MNSWPEQYGLIRFLFGRIVRRMSKLLFFHCLIQFAHRFGQSPGIVHASSLRRPPATGALLFLLESGLEAIRFGSECSSGGISELLIPAVVSIRTAGVE